MPVVERTGGSQFDVAVDANLRSHPKPPSALPAVALRSPLGRASRWLALPWAACLTFSAERVGIGFGWLGAEDTTAEAGLPYFFLTTSGLPLGEAYERWQTLMAPLYEVRPTTPSAVLPSGRNIAFQIGELVAHRTLLSTHCLQRDRRRVDAGPDHVPIIRFCYLISRAICNTGEARKPRANGKCLTIPKSK